MRHADTVHFEVEDLVGHTSLTSMKGRKGGTWYTMLFQRQVCTTRGHILLFEPKCFGEVA
jgi:hypothetical protein